MTVVVTVAEAVLHVSTVRW